MSTLAPPRVKTLRRSEVAEVLGVHPNTVLSWASRGWLDTIKLPGGEKRYPVDSVEALRRRIYGEAD
jgi:predicted site-specific integrase-resolvase